MLKIETKLKKIVDEYAIDLLSSDDFVVNFLNNQKNMSYVSDNKILEYYISTLLFIETYERYSKNNFYDKEKYYLKKVFKVSFSCYGLNSINGLTGIGYAIHFSRINSKRFNFMISKFDSVYVNFVQEYQKKINYDIRKEGLYECDYDIFDGLSAIINYFLSTELYKKKTNTFDNLVKNLIDVILSTQLMIPVKHIFSNNIFEKNAINFSLSHGMAGPLSVLTKVLAKGFYYKNIYEARDFIINNYVNNSVLMDKKIIWPRRKELASGIIELYPIRPSWCYGSMSIAMQLYKACELNNNNNNAKNMAIESIRTLKKTNINSWNMDSVTVCHGLAGALLCVNNMGQMVSSDELIQVKTELEEEIYNKCSKKYKYRFYNYNFLPPSFKISEADISMLTGSTGVIMTLMTVISNSNMHWTDILAF